MPCSDARQFDRLLSICGAAIACWLSLISSAAVAANPSLGSIIPHGARRGAEIEVAFNGARLADAQEIMLYYPGIKVLEFAAAENQVKTKLAIAPDCRMGIHAMRIRTASGISNLQTFSVGALPEIDEKEPNNDFKQPQPVAMGTTINGVVQNEDVDYFVIEARQGQRITAEIEGIRLGVSFFDPYVAILNSDRFELATSDDAALVWQDCVASVVAPKDDTYIIQVRESSFAGNGNCFYRLHVGHFPRPTATVPAGGKPGETLQVRWLGDLLGERTESITLPTAVDRMFGLFAQDEHGISPSSNPFRVNELANAIEVEPNNSPDKATPFTAPMALNGVISEPGDVDAFIFPAKKGEVYDVRVHARSIRSPLDSVLTIIRKSGAAVGNNDDSGQVDSYLRFNAPADDEYVVLVRDHLNQGGVNYSYRIELTPVQPKLTLGLPERQQYVDVTVAVPRGNRTAFLVSAARSDFGGDLNINAASLPAGMTLETVTMAANQTTVPVLLSAAAEAPLSGLLCDLVGKPVDANQKVEGHLLQDTMLVRGQNNQKVWGHYADRLALALTEECPFEINIVEPKAPLVQNGSMDLKVVATRKEGFTAPIAIRMLYNPPGVGSAGSVTIPEGKTEATIPLNASAGAELKTWKIVVMGEATVGNGPVLVSSKLTDLQVGGPFLNLAFNAAAVEQGQETEVVLKVEKKLDFDGAAKVELLGLPNEVTAEPAEITKDSTELVFKVKTTKASPAGKHKTLLARAVVTQHGEPVTHSFGGGELRIDVPLPPKVAPAATASTPATPAPAATATKPEKRLTRLEQLRLDREKAKQPEAPSAEPAKAGP